MRMRKKKNFEPRWALAAESLISDPLAHKGAWKSLHPGASSLCVELGCGKGAFLASCAAASPDVLFVGVERVQEALLMAMEKVRAQALGNVRFICGDAARIEEFFGSGEVDALHLNFCDPWPPRKQARRRMTHKDFLVLYRRVLKPGGVLRFKTDNSEFFEFTLGELAACGAVVIFQSIDWHRDPAYPGDDHMTEYEARFSALGVPICRLEAEWR